MNAILPDLAVQLPGLIRLRKYQSEFKHLQKAVSVLRCELNRKLQILPCNIQVKVLVVEVIIHMEAGPLTPDFPALRDLIETFNEGKIGLLETGLVMAPSVL